MYSIVYDILMQVWWLIPVMLAIALLRLPSVKGMLGESLVNVLLYTFLDKYQYHRLSNVTLPTLDGSTQIDHLIVSEFGIFVIETKAMKGWIFGSEKQAEWTQKIYRASTRFQNPLRQNYKHTKAIEAITGVGGEFIHSVIVFVGSATFKTEMPENVMYASGLVRYIRKFQKPVFESAQVLEIIDALASGRFAATRQTHKAHVENLQRRHDSNASRLCPRCGAELILRTVRSGARAGERFWGCSAYPRCRTVQSFPEETR